MASSYALPASAITSSHHGHTNLHSHSHSPSRQYPANNARNMRADRSIGPTHAQSHSETYLDNYSSSPQRNHSHSHHHHESDYSASPPRYEPISRSSAGLPASAFEKPASEPSPAMSQLGKFEPALNAVNVIPHEYNHHHDSDHDHRHLHPHNPPAEPKRSKFTNMLLPLVLQWPIMHTIMVDKDSRRIFYFMSLNFSFMIVQACYGLMTDSLGLLSDSIHMFFDCLALGVGLFAAIASKWPPSERFPYGFGKIESLSGFGNGVFLMLISIEIMIEATERLADGRETKRLAELFVVSAMGLAVNLIGMACFGHHGHHGHDHGHSHGGHDHGHSHSHSHSPSDEKTAHAHESCSHGNDTTHDHDHNDPFKSQLHNHDHDHAHSAPLIEKVPAKVNSHAGYSHSHENENMHGIFLHVLADTMGSAAVMVSTALIYFTGWAGWDPLASCIIAILIFLSSIPLIKSSAKKLLLTVPDEIEYSLREVLSGVSDIRGVGTYSVPKFWMGDQNTDSKGEQVLGVIHVSATRGSDLDDVVDRTRKFLLERGIDVVVQVEAAGDASCWCAGSGSRSPSIY